MTILVLLAASLSLDKGVSLAPGITYYSRLLDRPSVELTYLKIQQSYVSSIRTVLTSKMFRSQSQVFRSTVSDAVKAEKALGGINGDFFTASYQPLGILVHEGRLIAAGQNRQPVFTIRQDRAAIERIELQTRLVRTSNDSEDLYVNTTPKGNRITLLTQDAGKVPNTVPTFYLRVKPSDSSLRIGNKQMLLVLGKASPSQRTPSSRSWLLAFSGESTDLGHLIANELFCFVSVSSSSSCSDLVEAIGGMPIIVYRGEPCLGQTRSGLGPKFVKDAIARSFVGIDQLGNVILSTVRPRRRIDRNLYLDTMAKLAYQLGCEYALNLDGGSASELVIGNIPVTDLVTQFERPVANAIVVGYRKTPSKDQQIVAPDRVSVGSSVHLRLSKSMGTRPVWFGSEAVDVSPFGVLRPVSKGTGFIEAIVNGTVITKRLQVR